MAETMFALEVVVVPVSDPDRALEFYRDRVGFPVDVDYAPGPGFRVVQLTPPGSACSLQFGIGLSDAVPGSARRMHLVVADLERARAELVARGVEVGEIRHKTPLDMWAGALAPGIDEAHRDYASFAEFADPDGNTWVLQERGHSGV